MFRRSNKSSQPKLFSNTHSLLTGKSLKVYEDNTQWHNQFRVHITQRIDEELFRPLFHENFGSPNAPIRVLIAMMVLKDDNQVKGYSINITETCDEVVHQESTDGVTVVEMNETDKVKPLNLVTHVFVDVASAADGY
jgi:hypothetical protein